MPRLAVAILLAAAALSGCGNGGREGSAEVEAYAGDLPIAAPWLRTQLPAGTLAYQRIPHPFALIAMPKGNMLDTALGSDANIRNVLSIQQGVTAGLADYPALADPMVKLLLDHLRSPVEVAITGAPAPSALIGATLSLTAASEVEALFGEMSLQLPLVQLAGPLDAQGFGALAGLPVPAFLHFDEASRRLAIYGGQLATQDRFAALLAAPGMQSEHAMFALESEIDTSGQGLFGWIDAEQALQMGAFMLPPELLQALQVAGGMRALAFGAGIANGKGRLKLLADLGANAGSGPLPIVDNRIDATSAGAPRGLFLLSIPSPGEFTRLESLALSALPPPQAGAWDSIKQGFAAASGVTIEELLSAIGPELMTISDEAGEYVALRVRDRMLLNDVLERLSMRLGIAIDERSIAGRTIRHVSLPGTLGLPDDAFGADAPDVMALMSRMRTRVYWVDDGNYLYLAGIPQLLIDRARLGADARVADWLAETQRVDLSASLLAATGSVPRVPRLLYQGYLGMMQTLADLVDVEYDIFAMPTPDQLGLPERGSLGLSLSFGDPYVGIEMSYESHPTEILFGLGGMSSAAALGVIAGIAIPAYQDYTIRAQVAEGLNLSAAAKAAVAESYRATGEVPADRAAARLTPDARDTQSRYVRGVDVDEGRVIVEYGNAAHARLAGRVIAQLPYLTATGSIVWTCGLSPPPPGLEPLGATVNLTSVEPQYLPSACRP